MLEDLAGDVFAQQVLQVALGARSAATAALAALAQDVLAVGDAAGASLHVAARSGAEPAFRCSAEDPGLRLAAPADALDAAARVDSGVVTLVAAQTHTFTSPELPDVAAPRTAPVLRSANDLVNRRRSVPGRSAPAGEDL
ncbi:hypothetical protein [Kineococcus arenarius]|uniref:hypothetical protein n=1 Tax=Kineococcus sp. SYSU DK007 TaxID=3383128 RepID=UPI003D7EEAA3